MNWKMKLRATASVLAISLLAACGGGGGDSGDDGGPVVKDSAEGFYVGTTSNGRSLTGLVLDDGNYWILYSLANNSSVIGGVVQGNSTSTNGAFTSRNGRDFNFEGGGIGDFSIAGSYAAKRSIAGNLTYTGVSQQYSFSGTYDDSYGRSVTLADVAGSYSGVSASAAGTESASLNVTAAGGISGSGASGCRFTGTVTPRGTVAVYNLTLSFLGGLCEQGTSSLTGVAYLDPDTRQLFGAALNSARSDGALFVGQKAATPATSFGASSSAVVTTGSSSGCGSRGGPGYRKANGQCASWADYYAGRR